MKKNVSPTPAEWRAAMGYFPTGVTIVTAWQNGEPVGSTISAFTSVSLVPAMLLICLDQTSILLDPIRNSGKFGVNMLDIDSHELAMRFGVGPLEGRFENCGHRCVGDGAPQLDIAPVFIDCDLDNCVEAGDHFVLIGRGLRIEHTAATPPLLYHKGKFPRPWPQS